MNIMSPKIAVIGAGLMGHGIALVFADGGHEVAMTDPDATSLAAVPERVRAALKSLDKSPDAAKRIRLAASLEDAARDADIVFEAAPEKPELKQGIFEKLEAATRPDTILASNTSVIPIGRIAERVKNKARVCGTHWWNPPFLVPLVEVIETTGTAPETISRMMALLKGLGKVPVHVKKDVTGFVGNRLQHALWREAIHLVDSGVCDAETVDLVVKSSFGRRLAVFGPLEHADLVGTDLALDIQNVMLPDLDRSTEPTELLKGLVKDGKLGFKTNQGFKTWDEPKKAALRAQIVEHLKLMNKLLDG